MSEPARVFGSAAEAYELGRPDYPAAAVSWLLAGVRGTVLDLGAGSGKLSRAIAALGYDTVAVDPDARMLAHNPIEAHVGTAEDIPLADHSVAAVTVGQAWHWFDHDLAPAEIARVLVERGRLALAWNVYDRSDAVTGALCDVIDPAPRPPASDVTPASAAGFTDFEEAAFEWRVTLSPPRLQALVSSRSPFLIADPAEQRRTLAGVRKVVAAVAGSPDAPVDLAYRTLCYRAQAQA